jgi:hypothetical protein
MAMSMAGRLQLQPQLPCKQQAQQVARQLRQSQQQRQQQQQVQGWGYRRPMGALLGPMQSLYVQQQLRQRQPLQLRRKWSAPPLSHLTRSR